MAIGLGRMFGFRFPENFDRPYSSVSLTDFWRRWHMSLSRWLRDYVYIPLGGSRRGRFGTTFNLLFVFFVTGAWHGAAWTFILWGGYHGLLLVFERKTGLARLPADRWQVARRLLTFLLVTVGWVVFRAPSLAIAGHVLKAMVDMNFGPAPLAVQLALSGVSGAALVFGLANLLLPRWFVAGRELASDSTLRIAPALRVAVLILLPVAAVSVAAGTFSPFLYFRF